MAKKYKKDIPTLMTNSVSNFDESSRWVLDYIGKPYIESRKPPALVSIPIKRWSGVPGPLNTPLFLSREAMMTNDRRVLAHLETISPPERNLFPTDPKLKQEYADLSRFLNGKIGVPVANYTYSELLPCRKVLRPVLSESTGCLNTIIIFLIYPILAKKIPIALGIKTPEVHLEQSRAGFAKLEEKLSDGRNYLLGDTFSIADVWAASVASPIILPPEFGGNAPEFNDELPAAYKKTVEEMRQTPVGKYVLRIYAEHRHSKP